MSSGKIFVLAAAHVVTADNRLKYFFFCKYIFLGTGSGAIVDLSSLFGEMTSGKTFVLTAAHVVADAVRVEVQRNSDFFPTDKFPAKVRAVCHESDLALMEMGEPGFEPAGGRGLSLAEEDYLPELREPIQGRGLMVFQIDFKVFFKVKND